MRREARRASRAVAHLNAIVAFLGGGDTCESQRCAVRPIDGPAAKIPLIIYGQIARRLNRKNCRRPRLHAWALGAADDLRSRSGRGPIFNGEVIESRSGP